MFVSLASTPPKNDRLHAKTDRLRKTRDASLFFL